MSKLVESELSNITEDVIVDTEIHDDKFVPTLSDIHKWAQEGLICSTMGHVYELHDGRAWQQCRFCGHIKILIPGYYLITRKILIKTVWCSTNAYPYGSR